MSNQHNMFSDASQATAAATEPGATEAENNGDDTSDTVPAGTISTYGEDVGAGSSMLMSSASTTGIITMLNDHTTVDMPMHLEDLPLSIAAEALAIDVDRVQAGGRFLTDGILALFGLQRQTQYKSRDLEDKKSKPRKLTNSLPGSPRVRRSTVRAAGLEQDATKGAGAVHTPSGAAGLEPTPSASPTTLEGVRTEDAPDGEDIGGLLSSDASSACDPNKANLPSFDQSKLASRQGSSVGDSASESSSTLRVVEEVLDATQTGDEDSTASGTSINSSQNAASRNQSEVGGQGAGDGNGDLEERDSAGQAENVEEGRGARQAEIAAALEHAQAMEVKVNLV